MRLPLEIFAVLGAGAALAAALVLTGAATPRAEDGGTCGEGPSGAPSFAWVDLETAAALHRTHGALFVDARSEGEFEAGHIAGASHFPMDGGALSDAALARTRGAPTVVVYCDSQEDCARSARLALLLSTGGHPDVRVLSGGFPAWDAAGHPAEGGACRSCP